jgi:hypothetical protein
MKASVGRLAELPAAKDRLSITVETIPAARLWFKDDMHAAYWEMEEALAKGRADGWRRSKDRNRWYAARNKIPGAGRGAAP